MPALFEIGNSFAALDCVLDEIGGDVSDPAVDRIVTDWFAELQQQEADKLENYCQYIRRLESEPAVAKAEAEQFTAKAKARENRVKWLKEKMKAYLEAANRKEAVTSAGRKVCVQPNGGAVPVIMSDAVPVQACPREYLRVKTEADPHAIRVALESGVVLPFAKLGERGTQLRIRT